MLDFMKQMMDTLMKKGPKQKVKLGITKTPKALVTLDDVAKTNSDYLKKHTDRYMNPPKERK